MINKKLSKKQNKKNKNRKKRNIHYKSIIKTSIKKLKKIFLLNKNNYKKKMFFNVQSIIDKQKSKNIIHKNKASRYKSRLSKFIVQQLK